MELNLDDHRPKNKPPISKLILHDHKGETQFLLEYDTVDQEVQFLPLQSDPVTDILIDTKSRLTTDKGVEAFGTFIAGADNKIPLYRHLLSLYLPQEDSTFLKFHITIDDTLEHINLENSLLFATECYTILYDLVCEFLETGTISMTNYPLLDNFFSRTYKFDPYTQLMEGKDTDGSNLQDERILDATQGLMDSLERNSKYLDAADLYMMTISGAIMASKTFLEGDLSHPTLQMMTHSTINSPGMYINDGQATLWYPFTKSRVGKINRAISTTLNTLSYASAKRDMQEQVQTNIAHKFHDLLDIVSAHDEKNTPTLGLQTNVGNLVCSLGFKEEYQTDMDTILRVSQEISTNVKQYGQAILSRVAELQQFDPIFS